MLEKCGMPYNLKTVDVWRGEQFTPEFSAINPLQKIPAMVDSDGSAGAPYTVIESGAILLYLAEKTGKFIPHDPVRRYDCIQWLMVQMGNLGPMCGQLVHFSRFAPAGNDYGHARVRSQVNRLFDVYDRRLTALPYIAGTEYSIADIAAFPWLRNVQSLAIDLDRRRHLKAWVQKIAARPAVERALVKVAAITSVRDTASDDDKDRFFARGKYATT